MLRVSINKTGHPIHVVDMDPDSLKPNTEVAFVQAFSKDGELKVGDVLQPNPYIKHCWIRPVKKAHHAY